MARIARGLLVLLVAAAGQAVAPEGEAEGQGQLLGPHLVGHWKLVSFEAAGGNATEFPLGRDVSGQLIYDAAGHMAVQIMKLGRPSFESGDQGAGTAEEVSAAFQGYVAYFGTYVVDERSRLVTHRIAGSLFPNWIGSEQRREIVLEGDRLTLSTPPMLFQGKQRVFRLVWKRME